MVLLSVSIALGSWDLPKLIDPTTPRLQGLKFDFHAYENARHRSTSYFLFLFYKRFTEPRSKYRWVHLCTLAILDVNLSSRSYSNSHIILDLFQFPMQANVCLKQWLRLIFLTLRRVCDVGEILGLCNISMNARKT